MPYNRTFMKLLCRLVQCHAVDDIARQLYKINKLEAEAEAEAVQAKTANLHLDVAIVVAIPAGCSVSCR